jgi:hypothetical protein
MGVRADKGRRLANYLTGHTGIPFISWEGNYGIKMPAPYSLSLTTSRALQNWQDDIKALPLDRPHMAVRYDNALPDMDHAWVAMNLSGFIPLLVAHYNTISDRIGKE